SAGIGLFLKTGGAERASLVQERVSRQRPRANQPDRAALVRGCRKSQIAGGFVRGFFPRTRRTTPRSGARTPTPVAIGRLASVEVRKDNAVQDQPAPQTLHAPDTRSSSPTRPESARMQPTSSGLWP